MVLKLKLSKNIKIMSWAICDMEFVSLWSEGCHQAKADRATYRLNQPSCRFSENGLTCHHLGARDFLIRKCSFF